jgi:putative ABC transport system ATP-binding protein
VFEFINVQYEGLIDLPNLLIGQEQVTSLVGMSGSGKTTVLRMLNKMISPSRGRILFEGTDLKNVDSVTHRRKVVMLSQNPALFKGTIRDNLIAGLLFQGRQPPDDASLHRILDRVRLPKPLNSNTNNLSGGSGNDWHWPGCFFFARRYIFLTNLHPPWTKRLKS